MGKSEATSAKARVAAHRARLREQGLRPVQIWVPDVRSSEFARAAHEQSLAIAASGQDGDDQAFVDALSWDWAAGESAATNSPDQA